MDVHFIVSVYVTLDDICHNFLGHPKYRPKMVPAEILLVAIVAARYFNNNLERALIVLSQTGYIPAERRLSISRYNRQLHSHLDTFELCLNILFELSCQGAAFILDSMPVPVCKRKRARRCRKVRGRMFCGYCAAKDEKSFGWRLHLICDPNGLPVNFVMLPAALHDLTPIYELSYELPEGSALYGDKAYNDADAEAMLAHEGVRLIPVRRKNMKSQHDWADDMIYDNIAKVLKRLIVNWRVWVLTVCERAPMMASLSKFRHRLLPCGKHKRQQISNYGIMQYSARYFCYADDHCPE